MVRNRLTEKDLQPPFMARVAANPKIPSVKVLAACSAGLQKKILHSKNKIEKARLKEIRAEIEGLIDLL